MKGSTLYGVCGVSYGMVHLSEFKIVGTPCFPIRYWKPCRLEFVLVNFPALQLSFQPYACLFPGDSRHGGSTFLKRQRDAPKPLVQALLRDNPKLEHLRLKLQ